MTLYEAALPNNRIKLTDTSDCIPPDAVRVQYSEFPNDAHVLRYAIAKSREGFDVCVDTKTIDCYEFEAQHA